MHKLFILIPLSLAACGNAADTETTSQDCAVTASYETKSITSNLPLPDGFTVVEQSSNGYFIRLASAERASSATIRELADSLADYFDRVDLCLDVAHERGDEYLAIIEGKVYDYETNRIYSLNSISK